MGFIIPVLPYIIAVYLFKKKRNLFGFFIYPIVFFVTISWLWYYGRTLEGMGGFMVLYVIIYLLVMMAIGELLLLIPYRNIKKKNL